MINEYFFMCFYVAIKFVWRQNLCDKTLAVIPRLKILALIVMEMKRKLLSFQPFVSYLKQASFLSYPSAIQNLSSQINLIIIFLLFFVAEAA